MKPYAKINYSKLAIKNYKVSFLKYFVIALTFAISIMCFILSLSSGKIMQKEIDKFKDKNTAFNSIYIKNDGNTDEVYDFALSDERIENVYKQYKIKDVNLTFLDVTEKIEEKYPMSKATETMSYGVMPRKNKNEIAITPSLAKKFSANISELIGKKLNLKYNNKTYSLTISGIYNAGYDDFFASSDIEKDFYKQVDSENYYSINFDVKKFEDIVPISDELLEKEIKVKTAKEEVESIQTTFEKISKLFTIISLMILMISIFIALILFKKLKQTHLKMIKLLSVLGFNKKIISKLIIYENILLVINSIILIGVFVIIWQILI